MFPQKIAPVLSNTPTTASDFIYKGMIVLLEYLIKAGTKGNRAESSSFKV